MAKLFISIAFALALVAAVLGFLAKSNISNLQGNLKGARADLRAEQGKLQVATNDLKKSAEDLGMATDKLKEATATIDSQKTELTTKDEQVADAKKEVATQVAEVERLKILVAKVPETPAPSVDKVNVAELAAQLQEAKAVAEQAMERLRKQEEQYKANEEKLAALEAREKKRDSMFAAAGLQGKIVAVNPGWNFVVLNVGDKQGVMVNAPLLVVRGNAPVARLRITSVEPNTSVADVIPGSAARGFAVQPGDTVIFEGRASTTELMKPTAEPATTVAAPRPS